MSVVKLKWSRIKTKKSLGELMRVFTDNPYFEGVEEGFVSTAIIGDELLSKFACKRIKSYESEDPFGDKIKFELPEYIVFEFHLQEISQGNFLFCVIESPSTIKPFVNYMSNLLNYDFTVLPIDINLEETIFSLSNYVCQLRVSRLKVSGVKINSTAKATIEITSLNKGLEDLRSFVGEDNYRVDRVKGEALLDQKNVVFELSKHGTSMISERMIPVFKKVLAGSI